MQQSGVAMQSVSLRSVLKFALAGVRAAFSPSRNQLVLLRTHHSYFVLDNFLLVCHLDVTNLAPVGIVMIGDID